VGGGSNGRRVEFCLILSMYRGRTELCGTAKYTQQSSRERAQLLLPFAASFFFFVFLVRRRTMESKVCVHTRGHHQNPSKGTQHPITRPQTHLQTRLCAVCVCVWQVILLISPGRALTQERERS
jgi:hypothetical protein